MKKASCVSLVAVGWGLIPLMLFAPAASAEWGNSCSVGGKEENHCYALSSWEMSGNGNGSGEEVMGVSSEIYTVSMLVPYWESGDFITNEQWMINRNGGWAEDGQIAGADEPSEEGHEVNDDSLHPFWAFDHPSSGLWKWIDPQTVNGYEWRSYTEEDPGRNGTWCARFEQTIVECAAGFQKYSTLVTVGMEAGDVVQPENAGDDRTGAEFTGGGWYHWGKDRNETVHYGGSPSEASYICVRNWQAIPGYIEWGTPRSKWPC
jgi:hypothetical protein